MKSEFRVVSYGDEKLLVDAANEKTKGDKMAAAAFQEFYRGVQLRKMTGTFEKKSRRRISYLGWEDIPEYCCVTGLDFREILRLTNIEEVAWAKDIEREMALVCDAASDKTRKMILGLCLAVLPVKLREIWCKDDYVTKRAVEASLIREEKRYETWANLKDSTTYRKSPKQIGENRIPLRLRDVAFYASSFDVSPHWLLGLDESTCILAKNGQTEMIMDVFCLLPEAEKSDCFAVAEKLAGR